MNNFFKFPSNETQKRSHSCTLCNSSEGSLVGKTQYTGLKDYDVLQCQECGLLSVDPLPEEKIISEGSERFLELNESVLLKKKIHRKFKRSFRRGSYFAKRYLKKYLQMRNPKILEILAEDGYFSQGIARIYPEAEIFYTSFSEDMVRYLIGHFECKAKLGEFNRKFFPQEKFDLVILKNSLEGLQNPKKVLEEIYEVLSPNGLLYILTPNAKENFWNVAKRYEHQKESTLVLKNEFHYFLPEPLEKLLAETQFKIELSFKYGLRGHKSGLGHEDFKDFLPEKIPSKIEPLKKRLSMRYWHHHPSEIKWAFFNSNKVFSKILNFFCDRETDILDLKSEEGANFFILAKKL